MKKQILSSLVGIGAGLLGSTHVQGQWQTIDAFQLVPGLSANATDIVADPTSGLLYSVGSSTPDVEGNRTAVVRMSANQGASWTTVDTYFEPGWTFTHYRGAASDSSGRVFAAGHLVQNGPTENIVDSVWVVRESPDRGTTWGTTDLFRPSGGRASCGDIKVSPFGVVYAAGYGVVANGSSWIVRKRIPGQTSFATVDTVTGTAEARSIGFHPTAGVFVAGRVGNFWTVRRSADGVNWATVDTFKEGTYSTSSAESIAVDSVGTIYVAGRAELSTSVKVHGKTTTTTVENWVVRRSTTGGGPGSWSVVDRFGAMPQGSNISAESIAVGSGGVVFVAGNTSDSWLVRKGVPAANGTISWVTSEQYQLVSGQIARAWGITASQDGSIYATGYGNDASQIGYWLTRKLTP